MGNFGAARGLGRELLDLDRLGDCVLDPFFFRLGLLFFL